MRCIVESWCELRDVGGLRVDGMMNARLSASA